MKIKQIWIIDAIRYYLAFIFILYGKNKLIHKQFSFDLELLKQEVGKADKMDLSWYVFSFEPFNYFIGLSQLLIALLLLYRKTVLIGSLLFFTMTLNILIINLTFMTDWIKLRMVSKVCFLIFLDLCLIYFYKENLIQMIKNSIVQNSPKIKLNWKQLLYVPLAIIILNSASIFAKYIYLIFTESRSIHNIFQHDISESMNIFLEIFHRFIP